MYYLLSNNDIVPIWKIEILECGEFWRSVRKDTYFFTNMGDSPDSRWKGVYLRREDNHDNFNTLITSCLSLDDLPHSSNIIEILPKDSIIIPYTGQVHIYQGENDTAKEYFMKLFTDQKIKFIYTPGLISNGKKGMFLVYEGDNEEYGE